MNVSDVELLAIELPTSLGTLRTLLVRVQLDTGLEGWGEAPLSVEPAALAARRRGLAAVLTGQSPFDIEAILALEELAEPSLACAVEMALWDIVARTCRQPLAHLWGGFYRPNVPLCVRLPHGPSELVVQWARALLARGIASQMLTTTGSVAGDLDLVASVREACSDRVQLRLDAQGRFDLRGAMQLCERLEANSVQYVVDPVTGTDFERLALVGSTSRVALAAYRGVGKPADVIRLADAEASSYVIVDPVQVGGLARSRQCAQVAEAAGLAPSLRCEGTSGLAVAAGLQLAATTPAFIGGYACTYTQLHSDILGEPLRLIDGLLNAPSAAGLGVEVDRDRVERHLARN
jgi:L-alanine-DL-glutamate epimerase-like enolase superfamily enzyme